MTLSCANVHRMTPRHRREMALLALAGVTAGGLFVAHAAIPQPASGPGQVDWTGQLAAPNPEPPVASLSSASLVVPREQLALPPDPVKPKPHVKTFCDSADLSCVARAPSPLVSSSLVASPLVTSPLVAASPSVRKLAALEEKMTVRDPAVKIPPRPPGLIPNTSPDAKDAGSRAAQSAEHDQHPSIFAMAAHPFVVAGHTLAGWVKSF